MRPYPENVRRRKGVIFAMLAKRSVKTAEEAVRFLAKTYPTFSEHHNDLAAEWIERQTGAKGRRKRRRRAKATPGRKVTRGRLSKQRRTSRRGTPRNADRVIANWWYRHLIPENEVIAERGAHPPLFFGGTPGKCKNLFIIQASPQ